MQFLNDLFSIKQSRHLSIAHRTLVNVCYLFTEHVKGRKRRDVSSHSLKIPKETKDIPLISAVRKTMFDTYQISIEISKDEKPGNV